MNIRKFTLFSLTSIGLIAGGLMISSSKTESKSTYVPNESYFSGKKYEAKGYFEYMKMIRSNPATGKVEVKDMQAAERALKAMKRNNKNQGIGWRFIGPDNVGGRTRAIAFDRNDTNHIIAGGVSGGLWESFDGAVSWQPYDSDFKIATVSSIAQATDGTFYVGTGSLFDSFSEANRKDLASDFVGTGLYKLTGNGGSERLKAPGQDNSGATGWAYIQEIATDPNNSQRILVATNRGLKESLDGGLTFTDIIDNNAYLDVEMTSDGKITATSLDRVSFIGSIHNSVDNGLTFNTTTFNAADRIEIAIAPSNTNIQYASIVNRSNSCLLGVYRTRDAGQNWELIQDQINYLGRGANCPGRGQGFYDNEIIVFPNNPGKFIAGGIEMVSWVQTSTDPAPIEGSWNGIAISQLPPGFTTNPFYVHADIHKFVFNPKNPNTMIIGHDGGITVSFDINNTQPTYSQADLGYNVTQFYDIGVGPTGLVTGGTQDNGTLLMGLPYNAGRSGLEVNSGDGFDTELSFINPTLGLVSSQFGAIRRLQGIGTTLGNTTANTARILSGDLRTICEGNGDNCTPFYSSLRLWESFDHNETNDSVLVQFRASSIPPIKAGTLIPFESKNNDIPLEGFLNQNLFPKDTLPLIDDVNDLSPRNASFDSLGISKFIANFDTITINRNTEEVYFHYRGKARDTVGFNFGTALTYKNIFFDENLRIVVDSFNIAYEKAPIEFLYETEFPDIIQSMTILNNVIGRTNSTNRDIWMSRDVLKGGNVNEPRWFKIAGARRNPDRTSAGEAVLDSEFSKNGNYLFVGTSLGRIYRLKGLNNLDISQISIDAQENDIIDSRIMSFELMKDFNVNVPGQFKSITGIALDPNNNNNLIVTFGNYGVVDHVWRTTNALIDAPTRTVNGQVVSTLKDSVQFVEIQGVDNNSFPDIPVYDAIIDRQDSNRVLIATEYGVFGTMNAFTDVTAVDSNGVTRIDVQWTEENHLLGRVPVMAIEQTIFTKRDGGAINEGQVYIGTHGRGAFVTDQLVSLKENFSQIDAAASLRESLMIYPNPVSNAASIRFNALSVEPVRVQVFNISGALVKELGFTNIANGENNIALDFTELSNGTYILRAIQGQNTASTKFVKR